MSRDSLLSAFIQKSFLHLFKNHSCIYSKIIARLRMVATSGFLLISGRVDGVFATETVDLGSIPSRVKTKTIKIGIHSFPA